MKKLIPILILTLISLIILTGCSESDQQKLLNFAVEKAINVVQDAAAPDQPALAPVNDNPDTITIASWNIQAFGPTKATDPDRIPIIAATISQFDLVAIQEIRDRTGTAIQDLEAAVDKLGMDYKVIIGPRLGRSTMKEQYAYIYRADKIKLVGSSYTYDDPEDIFHREPFIACFQTTSPNSTFDVCLINTHVDPDEAHQEIDNLAWIVTGSDLKHRDEDIIVLGDFNSDCSYYDENQPKTFITANYMIPAITNAMDTNLAKSDCTYDRIMMTSAMHDDWTGNAGVYLFDIHHTLTEKQAKKISDHYPVWAEFNIYNTER